MTSVVEPGRKWAAIVLAVFVLAMVYASACTASCSVGQCINPLSHSESSDDHHHHGASEHPGVPSDQNHSRPDCGTHGHPESFVKGPSTPQVRSTATIWVGAVNATVVLPHLAALKVNTVPGRNHTPAQLSKEPVYKKISVLRI